MKTPIPKRTVSPDDYYPATGHLLIRPEKDAAESEGGIIIPDQARKTLNEGEILKAGEDTAPFKPGMYVVFDPNTEHALEIEKGVEVLVVHVNNVIMWRHPQTPLFPITFPQDKFKCERHNWNGNSFCPRCSEEYGKQSARQNPCN